MAAKEPDKISVVVGYVRISTDNQIENYSVDEQIARIKAYCAAKGWVLLKIYTDGGYSGGNTDRPALQQMLQDIKDMGIDAVVVYKLDRLSRSQKDTLTLIEDEFLANRVDFVSINENFDTSSPFGRAMIGILSVFAQLEKDQITERFTMGRIGRSKAGYFHGGPTPPTGYDYIDGKLVVSEYEALIVREIFSSFLAGKSINSIWHEIQGEYIGSWSATKIRNILKNSVYVGKVKFAGTENKGLHEPIIAQGTFDMAQRLLSSFDRENKKTSAQRSPFRAGYLLSSLVVCARCGARYSANHGYYKCYSRAKSSPKFVVDPSCKNENWEIGALDQAVIGEVRALLDNPAELNGLLSEAQGRQRKPDVKRLTRRIDEIDKQLERAVELYQVGGIPMDVVARNVHALDEEKRRLTNELVAGSGEGVSLADNFLQASKEFLESFDASPLETQRQTISSLIESIKVDGRNVNIKWRL